MQYLMQWRMQRATRLLAAPGARNVAAVAEAVGYESEAAFSRAFKKCVGMAPLIGCRPAPQDRQRLLSRMGAFERPSAYGGCT